MSYKLIREYAPEILAESFLEESTGKKTWTISGITLQSEIKNKNKRIYPKNVLTEAISKHVNEFMDNDRALGELNHPDDGTTSINLDRVSHKFFEINEDKNDYITKAKVLGTPCGKIVENLLEGEVKLGISSRGLGRVNRKTNDAIVEALYIVSFGDIVSDPSAPDAYVQGILESVEFELVNNNFVRKEINGSMDAYSKKLKAASKAQIDHAVQQVFTDFLSKLKL